MELLSCLAVLFPAFVSADFQNANGIELSCYLSYVPKGMNFCFMIDWRTARGYDKLNYNVYEPNNELQAQEQDDYARYLYNSYNPSSESGECRSALRRALCATVFPECLDEGGSSSGVSYYRTCKAQCEQMKSCSFDYEEICNGFPTSNCVVLVAPGFFILNPEKGPYTHLPTMCGVVLALWVVIAVLWHYLVFYRFKDSGALVCRALAGLPLIKVTAVAIGVSFWATCELWGMCSFWLSVAYVNTNLIFDTCLMGAFLVLAKGWSITRHVMPPNEWRSILVLMSGFYLATSINLVLEASVYTTEGFWIANIIVYGIVYSSIVHSTIVQIKAIKVQVDPFKGTNYSREIVGPLKMKYRMYILFLLLIGAFISTEVLTHSLLFTDDRVWVALTFFEISQIILLLLIGFFFRPREFSPFFFMIQTTMNDQRVRPTPIVEVDIDHGMQETEAEDGGEVDVTPLLRHTRIQGPPPCTMVFLKQPDGNVNLAVMPKSTKLIRKDAPTAARSNSISGTNGSRQMIENSNFVDLAIGSAVSSTPNVSAIDPLHFARNVRSGAPNSELNGRRINQSEELEMRTIRN